MGKIGTGVLVLSIAALLIIVIFASSLSITGSRQQGGPDSVAFPPTGIPAGVSMTETTSSGSATMDTGPKVGVTLDADAGSYAVGDTIIVTASGNVGDINVIAGEMVLSYDESVLSLVSAEKGDLFANAREIGPETDVPGQVKYTLLVFQGNDVVSGQGTFATFTFTAKASGTTDVTLAGDSVVGAVGVSAKNILGDTQPARITVN